MFNRITIKERLRKEEAKNNALNAKNQQLEEAVLELASLVSKEVEDGETIPE